MHAPNSAKASVAITGGSGGLGLLMAKWLAASGAVSSITLLSRAGRLSEAAAADAADWLPTCSVPLTLQAADMSRRADVHALLCGGGYTSSAAAAPPVFDVLLHAAGVLKDGLLGSQSAASMRAVMAPKLACDMLAAATAMPLQQVLLFSSVASCVGAAGQANYVAANAVLDGRAAAGRLQGHAVTSVQWGAWASAGERGCPRMLGSSKRACMHAHTLLLTLSACAHSHAGMASAAVKERLNRLGQGVLQPASGLAALAAILRGAAGLGAGSAVVTVNPFRWQTYLSHMQVCWQHLLPLAFHNSQ